MFHVYWPVTAALTLLVVVGTIVLILKYGSRCLKLRHTTFADDHEWNQRGTAYEHKLTYEHDV